MDISIYLEGAAQVLAVFIMGAITGFGNGIQKQTRQILNHTSIII